MEVGGQREAPAALSPRQIGNPLHIWLAGHQGRSGRMRKISSHRGSNPEPSSPLQVAIPIKLFLPFGETNQINDVM